MAVYRVYVEKKPEFAVESKALLNEIQNILLIKNVKNVRLLNRYDVENVDAALFQQCLPIVFSEPQVDNVFFSLEKENYTVIYEEYLPGQFDQRAQSAEECVQFVSQKERPTVRTARIYLLEGTLTEDEIARIKKHLINPVESREADLSEKETLHMDYETKSTVETLTGFISLNEQELQTFVQDYALAMDKEDLLFCQNYFKQEQKDPTITEIRMIDTYWSDHCRHTTFLTTLENFDIHKIEVEKAFSKYLSLRKELYGDRNKPITLMDMATIGTKALKKEGYLKNIDESEEINACSINIQVNVDGKDEDYLLMFKNETHNHPTEIEPFGGAATCIGGAIRDPLSGRTYVYQAMRVTGASNPLLPVADTIKGKLPQRKIVTTAAKGYSAYGNQIGLATGMVDEMYHEGYVAKRLEIGAVVGAAPKKNVRRECPNAGDIIVLLGGRTGRDGCGGATGSSKSHKLSSLTSCGAEVQKGNPVVERKLQRLFRDEKVTCLIKRCNDFGAGGVSVAIGELADGLIINLDKVPKKYEGLDGTELAISESQERMAVVIEKENVDKFIEYAHNENLEATVVAEVTEEKRLKMTFHGKIIVDLSRDFLNSNGAQKHAEVEVENTSLKPFTFEGNSFTEKMHNMVQNLNICSKKGLSERFDSTIGAGTVLMPFGGKHQTTPTQAMVAKIPLLKGHTNTVSGMAYGFHPELMAQSPFEGAYLSVVESLARLCATGLDTKKAYLTFQEYFERMTESSSWGKPMSALLGALKAQLDFKVAAIGGKDSMSGTFENIHVPPTLVSFAVSYGDSKEIISPEFKKAGSTLCLLSAPSMDADALKKNFELLYNAIQKGEVLSAYTLSLGGLMEGIFKMSLGNKIGANLTGNLDLFGFNIGSFILEMKENCTLGTVIGQTTEAQCITVNGDSVMLSDLITPFENKLHSVFPYKKEGEIVDKISDTTPCNLKATYIKNRPVAFVPAFPGTNCEIDTARALERAGAEPKILLINNLSKEKIEESILKTEEIIKQSQMIVLPGGFSGGDEPEGSAKFITAFFRNPRLKDAVHTFLKQKEGLMLGICNGFQALIKLGLVPYGEIIDTDDTCPTLTFNTIGRHQSMLVNTRICSTKSPWLQLTEVDDTHLIAISHGEGRFVASKETLDTLIQNGQIATQYVDLNNNPTMDLTFNPNGSMLAIEGITSLDGRILGKMGHTERSGNDLYKNVPGNAFQPLFEGGVKYFK